MQTRDIDLTYLSTLIGESAEEIDAKMLADLVDDDNFTLAMFRAGFLTFETDINGNITGFIFDPPQNFDYFITGTSADDFIATGNGDDFIYAGGGRDTLDAGAGNDSLNGGDGNDTLHGGDGNDTLYGDGGSDVLYGGAGDDILYGGAGIDSLYGGAGADIFTFRSEDFSGLGFDVIQDFNLAEGDKIDISDLLEGFGADSNIADYVYLSPSGNDTLVNVDIDGQGGANEFVAITVQAELTYDAFIVDNGTIV
jgi:Ca2+-binding RTX toxin-like protein